LDPQSADRRAVADRVRDFRASGPGRPVPAEAAVSPQLLRVENVTKRFGDVTALPAHARARLGLARSFQLPRPFHSMTLAENLAIPRDYAARHDPPEPRALLERLGLGAKADALPRSLTQIELRKLEVARALAGQPRLLICDEAMAGLSHAEVDEMLGVLFALNEGGIAILMIEHIMRAVMRFSERIVVLDAGRKIADGAPDAILRDKEVERAYLGA